MSANPSLETGLAALKQSDYITARAHLEAVCKQEKHPAAILKAQIGLVTAYARTGDTQKAIALCQTLSRSTSPVKNWAEQMLANLQTSHPQTSPPSPSPTAAPTGFVPLSAPPKPNRRIPRSNHLPSPPPSENPPKANQTPITQQQLSSPNPAIPATNPPISASQPPSYQPVWRNAGRAKKARPLKAVKKWRLWLLQAESALALFILARAGIQFILGTTNELLVQLPLLDPIQNFYELYYAPNNPILIVIALLLILSPWLWDGILQLFYGQKPLSWEELAKYSPESVKSLKGYCWKKNLPWPKLKILPIAAPIALSYGNLPHTARIVVSQGLLEQLADDEIATICAAEFGHVINGDLAFMSLAVLAAHIPYIIYWQCAQLADRLQEKSKQHFVYAVGVYVGAAVSALSYGLYWLLRWSALWLSRVRLFYSDRFAVELTNNPNALTRALLKIAIGITADIQQKRQTSYLLESLEMLMPVGYRQAITVGSVYAIAPLASVLEWDYSNPYRRWLAVNNSHPPLGERLYILGAIARFWNLETELDFPKQTSKTADNAKSELFPLFLQAAPFIGVVLGLGVACILWLMVWTSVQMRVKILAWMLNYNGWLQDWLILALLLTGFSLGTFIRINVFFPDIKPSNLEINPKLPVILSNPDALPIDSLPIRLEGKLIGRLGISNWLGQDLLLQTGSGLVKLHWFSVLGPIGNFWQRSPCLDTLINQPVVVTGWFRRGATPWIDLETLTGNGKRIGSAGARCLLQGSHPIWSTILACASALWAVYLILQGGL
ncbi:MAG: M48 family metalloprotease [Oscillatoriaceae bacterium SKW80]|nr:M48 family metalloprotease [Oscillatoriaceae bacterium SKYG93]MCX8121058.1 M48 family metalloprotease [Oscillatoriaceae bacterium SKW80]MDW8452330.1 M48 family metalloprotease [Oscillatoriaceae cyanobacterium SKYGB_i_bin93]HIK26665.1 M48 family metalloprotease [Oscillatoriaceae cyanobacterium M7585_C2015_266]